MGQRDRDAVGGIGRRRRCPEPQQLRHHVAHLRLECRPPSHDRLLDLRRRVLGDRNAGLLRREEDDAAGVAQHDRGAHVLAVKGAFDRHGVGSVAGEERGHAVMDARGDGRQGSREPWW